MMMNRPAFLLLAVTVSVARSFTAQPARTSRGAFRIQAAPRSDDFPPEEAEEYTGSVDWDAEWKKVVANEGKVSYSKERPGKDFYKSEAEIAAIKAANRAAEKAAQASNSALNSMPDIRSLSGDWKFWIGLLAVVSVGLSLLSAPSAQIVPPNDGSYYI